MREEWVDISEIAAQNHAYARHLLQKQGVVVFKEGLFRYEKALHDPFVSIDLWRELCIGAEILLKAALLRHEVSFFRKRAHAEYGPRVRSSQNRWLQDELDTLEIDYIAQINTGTVSTALRSAKETLFEKIALAPTQQDLISEAFYIIIRTRRNRNTHFFFPNQAVFDESELEILFLPLLNILETIYQK